MIYKIKRFNSDEKSVPVIEPPILDLRKLERRLLEMGYSDRQIDIILDELRRIDMAPEDEEEIMGWIRTGEVLDPEVLRKMKSKGLDFPAAWIEVKGKGKEVRQFSIFGKIKDWMDRYNEEYYRRHPELRSQKKVQPSPKPWFLMTPEEKLKSLKQTVPDRVSPLHKKLLSIKGPNISWGDGDEYPSFYINDDGVLQLGCQHEPWYTWEKNRWIKQEPGSKKGDQKIYNLKADLLKWFKEAIKEWEEIDYLDDDQTEEVIRELKRLYRDIQQKL